jgi:hypothetical protein
MVLYCGVNRSERGGMRKKAREYLDGISVLIVTDEQNP